MDTAVVLFTRDLRVHDNPALAAACRTARRVVPLFVLDRAVPSNPNRDRFLVQCLADLRAALRGLGGDLIVRRGDAVEETLRLASDVDAAGIALMGDVSGLARQRERRLLAGAGRRAVRVFPGATVLPPGAVRPAGGNHYQVFTPYWRAWRAAERRRIEPVPRRVLLPEPVPSSVDIPVAPALDGFASGGESAGRRRVRAWLRRLGTYAERHDDLPGDATSRLSPYLHFGCVSPLELVSTVDGAEAFVRQVCWRDFYAQVLYAFPELRTRAYRAGANEEWVDDGDALAAWRAGQTGVPIVDAGMRQLAAEGWMHNRARLITASYLVRQLRLDWRAGGRWYDAQLVDADVANNYGNWQWVAGTGNDTKPYRRFNPVRQARRFDPDGEYVRRYVPELAAVAGGAVHEPWKLDPAERRALKYPEPLALD
jgi:deoxyribodipyrimidine photo-lyase